MPKIIKSAKGSFTSSSISVDSSGRVYTASSGAGAANMVLTSAIGGSNSGTFTADPSSNKILLYLRGGGGGGGGGNPGPHGDGGLGGFGVWAIPISQPYAVPYSNGAGSGLMPDPNSPGATGGSSTFDTNKIAVGGNGGGRGPTPGNPGSPGAAPGATVDFAQPTNALMAPFYLSEAFGEGPVSGNQRGNITGGGGPGPAGTGTPGGFKIYEDLG